MNDVTIEKETVTKYELRKLQASDIFSMARVIEKIGVSNFKRVLDNDNVQQLISTMSDEEKQSDKGLATVGVAVVFEIVDVIFRRLPECEAELYNFLASVSGLKVSEIKELSMADFFEMIVEVIKKEEFKDFFKAASRLFK